MGETLANAASGGGPASRWPAASRWARSRSRPCVRGREDRGVVGAGVGGLAAADPAGRGGHGVTVLEQGGAPGGKCGPRDGRGGFRLDTGPSLLTMPWVFRDLFAATGARSSGVSSCCGSSR